MANNVALAESSTALERLRGGGIDLWCVVAEDIHDEPVLDGYRRLLTEDERRRGEAYYFARDRHRHLVTRALLRTTLSRYVPIAPQDWRFVTNHYGRPEIANPDPRAQRLRFNVSHTQGLILLGVTADRAIGVDTENAVAQAAPLDIAERYFAADEVAALRALPLDQQRERFFDYWTLKESYIKARGMGLSIPLDRFAFHLQPATIALAIEESLGDRGSRWRFWQFRPTAAHHAAVCVERFASPELAGDRDAIDRPAAQVCAFKTVPSGDAERLDCAWVRASD